MTPATSPRQSPCTGRGSHLGRQPLVSQNTRLPHHQRLTFNCTIDATHPTGCCFACSAGLSVQLGPSQEATTLWWHTSYIHTFTPRPKLYIASHRRRTRMAPSLNSATSHAFRVISAARSQHLLPGEFSPPLNCLTRTPPFHSPPATLAFHRSPTLGQIPFTVASS
jgi:hypothetical protein